MLTFLYKTEFFNNKKNISCLCVKVENNQIKESKLTVESFEIEEDIKTKWPWYFKNENHIEYTPSTNLPLQVLNNVIFLLDEGLEKLKNNKSFLYITKEDLDIKYKDQPHLIDIEISNIFFLTFSYFNENPELIFEFGLFEYFKNKNNLEDYSIEDFMVDMEENLEKLTNSTI